MAYEPLDRRLIEIGAEALQDEAFGDWDFETDGQDTPRAWPMRQSVAREVLNGLREAGVTFTIPEGLR